MYVCSGVSIYIIYIYEFMYAICLAVTYSEGGHLISIHVCLIIKYQFIVYQ